MFPSERSSELKHSEHGVYGWLGKDSRHRPNVWVRGNLAVKGIASYKTKFSKELERV
jgi:hypothetical protein